VRTCVLEGFPRNPNALDGRCALRCAFATTPGSIRRRSRTRRGSRMGGLPGGGVAVGGGGVGLVGLLIYLAIYLLGGGGGSGPLGGLERVDRGADPVEPTALRLQDGRQPRTRAEDCRIVGDINSIQKYCVRVLPNYTIAKTVFFTDSTSTGCGTAFDRRRPVLLPGRRARVHRPRLLRRAPRALRRQGWPLAEAYVLAHEYGHHVQDIKGTLAGGKESTGPEGGSVRTELQADCYAGVWVRHATETGTIVDLTKADVKDAPRCGRRSRRRSHPEGVRWPGEPGDLDARLGGRARPLVHRGLQRRLGRLLQHPSAARSDRRTTTSAAEALDEHARARAAARRSGSRGRRRRPSRSRTCGRPATARISTVPTRARRTGCGAPADDTVQHGQLLGRQDDVACGPSATRPRCGRRRRSRGSAAPATDTGQPPRNAAPPRSASTSARQ